MLCFYLIILAFLSLNPWLLPDSKEAIGLITWDLLDHAVAYGGLSILMMSIFRLKDNALKVTLTVILLSSLIGILFECGQYWLTLNRQFSLFDATANVFGTLFGVMIFWCIRIFRQKFS